jgi:hypothetical protein
MDRYYLIQAGHYNIFRNPTPGKSCRLFYPGWVTLPVVLICTLGSYYRFWYSSNSMIDQCYRTLTFPFKEIDIPSFYIEAAWILVDLTGFLDSWSATWE